MDCPECDRLKSERDAAERRYENAVRVLRMSGLDSGAHHKLLKIESTEAKLYWDMAEGEIGRHETLAHKARRGTAVMTASWP